MNGDLRKYINSLNDGAYVTAKISHKFLYGKELTREEFELMVDEKIKRLKGESDD